MMHPPLCARITSTRPSQWVWRVSLDGKRVGTVYGGDAGVGFTARDIDFHLLGRSYPSAEAAMLACVAVMSTVTSLQQEMAVPTAGLLDSLSAKEGFRHL